MAVMWCRASQPYQLPDTQVVSVLDSNAVNGFNDITGRVCIGYAAVLIDVP
jgi:hypothetical protein